MSCREIMTTRGFAIDGRVLHRVTRASLTAPSKLDGTQRRSAHDRVDISVLDKVEAVAADDANALDESSRIHKDLVAISNIHVDVGPSADSEELLGNRALSLAHDLVIAGVV